MVQPGTRKVQQGTNERARNQREKLRKKSRHWGLSNNPYA